MKKLDILSFSGILNELSSSVYIRGINFEIIKEIQKLSVGADEIVNRASSFHSTNQSNILKKVCDFNCIFRYLHCLILIGLKKNYLKVGITININFEFLVQIFRLRPIDVIRCNLLLNCFFFSISITVNTSHITIQIRK